MRHAIETLLLVVMFTALLMVLVLLVVAVGFMFREGFIFFLVALASTIRRAQPLAGAASMALRNQHASAVRTCSASTTTTRRSGA